MSIGRFNERFQIKGHLSAGAHGVIFAATDKREYSAMKEYSSRDAVIYSNRYSGHSSRDSDDVSVDLRNGSGNNDIEMCEYAIKRIFVRNRIMPLSLLREIKSLEFLRGTPNVSSFLLLHFFKMKL